MRQITNEMRMRQIIKKVKFDETSKKRNKNKKNLAR